MSISCHTRIIKRYFN